MSEVSLISQVSETLGKVNWGEDFQTYLTPFRDNYVNILLALSLWLSIHFVTHFVALKTGAVARVIKNMKEADVLKKRTRKEKYYQHRATFDISSKVTATVHAFIVSIFAVYAILSYSLDDITMDVIYDPNPFWVGICTFSAGYFAYDFVVAIWDNDPQYLIHGSASFIVYGHASNPFCAKIGIMFLCYEVSAILLHLRWFMIQAGKGDGPLFSLVENSFAGFFLLIRVGWGNWYAFTKFHPTIWKLIFLDSPIQPHSKIACIIYSLSNIAIQLLNVYWASMILNVLRRSLARSKNKTKTIETDVKTIKAKPKAA